MSEKIVLREITYEQMSTLVTELKTDNFVKDKEIERLNNIIKTKDEGIKAFTEDLCEESTKVEKLENIIKEVREKIKEFCWDYEYETYSNMTSNEVKELAEILDKEKK